MKLCDFYIKRPAFTTALSLLLIAIGFICYQKLPVRYLPKMTVPVVTISTDYPGASSSTVETQVTNILEGSMSGLSGLKYMTSTSQNGNSQIVLTFKLGTNLDNAAADARANVAKVLDQLPLDAKPPIVSKTNPNAQPILFLAYFNPNESVGALTNYVKQFIVPQFEASPGVAKVALWSSHYYALRIWLNPAKMAARDITVDDVTKVLKNQNATVPTGTIKGDQLSYTVVTDLKLHRPSEFANLVIKDKGNHVIRLKDIAEVSVGSEHRTSDTMMRYFSVDGKPGVAIGLIPETGANALNMTNEALKLSHQISDSLPEGMRQIVEYNQSNFTQAALYSVYEAIIEAFILVLLVITLFLGSIRSALVPIVTVPICLLSAFAVIYFLGYSINSITLLALVLAVGLVVDDAIIMLENISRFIEQGYKPLTAAFKGSKQIAFPVIVMTITLAGIYVPVAFASGISGVFFKEFAFTLLGAIFISGFVALTLSPMMCAKLLKPHHSESRYSIRLTHIFQHLQSRYHKALALHEEADVVAVQLAGREDRLSDKFYTHISQVVDEVSEQVNKLEYQSIVLLGYCMGGLIAYELAQALSSNGKIKSLIIAASAEPEYAVKYRLNTIISDEELVTVFSTMFEKRYGLPPDTEYLEMMLPILKADRKLNFDYHHQHPKPIGLPLYVFGGIMDEGIPSSALKAWSNRTTSDFNLEMFSGDHMFIDTSEEALLFSVNKILRKVNGD